LSWTAIATQRFGQKRGTPREAHPFKSGSHSGALVELPAQVVVRQNAWPTWPHAKRPRTTAAESILDERRRTQTMKGEYSASRRQAPRLSCRAGVALLLLAAPRAALSAPPISKDGSTAAPAVQPPALTSE